MHATNEERELAKDLKDTGLTWDMQIGDQFIGAPGQQEPCVVYQCDKEDGKTVAWLWMNSNNYMDYGGVTNLQEYTWLPTINECLLALDSIGIEAGLSCEKGKGGKWVASREKSDNIHIGGTPKAAMYKLFLSVLQQQKVAKEVTDAR